MSGVARTPAARHGAVLLALLLAAGCRAPPPAATVAPPATAATGAVRFQVDPQASRVWLHLHADGPLAAIGHAHVIVSQELQGTVWLQPQIELSSFELQFPVEALLVDDPGERQAAGGEYAEPLDEAARAGTRAHMLGDTQLDAAHFPLVTLRSSGVRSVADGLLLDVQVTVRDHTSSMVVPVQWQQQGETLNASGAVRLQQSALGLSPYTALFGALRVADTIEASFRLVARRSGVDVQ
jgi:polyisoprenoid-binding protein YceI